MNILPPILRTNEPLRDRPANRIMDELFRLHARPEFYPDELPNLAHADLILARIVAAETPANGRRIYHWTECRQGSDGRVTDARYNPSGNADWYPAYEEEGNPHVPLDGSAVVWLRPGSGGSYFVFSYRRRPVWAELGSSSGDLYAWSEVYPTANGTWASMSGGQSGTVSQNAAIEMYGVTGITAGTIVQLFRGYGEGAPQVIVNREQLGDGDSTPEQHSVSILRAVGGTFTLTFDGQTTANIAYNANAAAVESALEALSNITAVTVTGAGTSVSPFIVQYDDDFDSKPILLPDYSSLQGEQEWLFDGGINGDITFPGAITVSSLTVTSSLTVQNSTVNVTNTTWNYNSASTVNYVGTTVNISNSGTWAFTNTTVNISSGTWTYQNTVNVSGGTWTFSSTSIVNFTSTTNINSLNQLTVTNTTAITLGSNQNNYAITKYFTNIEPTANIQITGVSYTSVAVGVIIIIYNSSTDYYIELTNEDGSSTSTNQFSFPWKTSFFLPPKKFIKLYYNGSKWVPKAHTTWGNKPYAPSQITTNQDDYDLLHGVIWWKFSTDASRNITGFQKGYCGRQVYVFNGGSNNLVLQHQNASSTAANRLYTQSGQDHTLKPGCGVWIWYDCDISRWRVLDCCGVTVRKNSTGSEYQRRRLNFIEGSNVTLTVSDDSTDDEIDVTIAASSSGTTSENGESVLGSDYTITDTYGDTGLDVTLGPAGTYWIQGEILIEAEVSALSTGAEIWLRLYNETDAAAVTNSGTLGLALLATGLRYKVTVPIGKIITTDSDDEVIRLEAQQNSSSPTWTFSKIMASYTDYETRLRQVRLA